MSGLFTEKDYERAEVLAGIILRASSGRRCPRCRRRMTYHNCSECGVPTVEEK